jgi:hypothetical protein
VTLKSQRTFQSRESIFDKRFARLVIIVAVLLVVHISYPVAMSTITGFAESREEIVQEENTDSPTEPLIVVGNLSIPDEKEKEDDATETEEVKPVPKPKKKEAEEKVEEEKEPELVRVDLPPKYPESIDINFMALEYADMISNRDSLAYRVTNSDKRYIEDGFYKIDGAYLVALGTYYTENEDGESTIGRRFKVTLVDYDEEGNKIVNEFDVIHADDKADRHTDSLNMYTRANHYTDAGQQAASVLEFIVCPYSVQGDVAYHGNASKGYNEELKGRIARLERYTEIEGGTGEELPEYLQ